jgi:glycosyltransferase involved in cell wall biosynthesis
MNLSVIIIAKDAEATVRRCLESVAWADEVVVVENGSADRTADIARELGAKVHQTADWPGYGQQKNRALDLATGDWLFSLDADEWVTPGLRDEIRSAIAGGSETVAFRIPRKSSFCGRFMRHSGWWPDYVVRVFKRGNGRFSPDAVHERVIVEGRIGSLRECIMHEAITDLDQMLTKMNRYSSTSAAELHKQGRRGSFISSLFHGGWAFLRTYVLRLGFLDGREGFMLAVANAEGAYYRYLKLTLLDKKKP